MHRQSNDPRPRHGHRSVLACLTCLGLALAGTSSACGSAGRLGIGGADTAFVGVAVGLTNPERYVNVYSGVQLALDELNAHRAAGAPVLALRRAPADATSPVAVAAYFRDDSRVMGVVGHTESGPTIAAASIYDDRANDGKRALVAVSPTASAAAVTRVSHWIFRVVPVADEQGRALARFVADSLGLKRAGVIYRNDPSGKDFLGAFVSEFVHLGGTVVERDPYVEEIPDFAAYARRLARRAVPAVAISGNASGPVMLALRRAGSQAVVLGTNGPGSGDGALSQYTGMRYAQFYSADHPATPEGAGFAKAFQAREHVPADHWAALSYDAAMLIGQAVQAEGPNRRKVRDWVAAVGRGRAPFAGATGRIAFDANGDPVNKVVLVQEVGR